MTENDLLLYVGIWTVCAVGAWFIATTKKAPDAGMWALGGLLLGPLGVLGAIAFAKPPKAGTEARVCAHCGGTVASDRLRLCDNCGRPFSGETA